jgi:recombination protein RecT
MANENKQVAVSKMDSLKKMLDAPSVVEQFQNAVADNSGPFIASLIDLYGSDNYLQNCEPKHVIAEALKAAVLKLPIIKTLGFAYIVPYKSSGNAFLPQFQIGYKGLIQLAMRTSQYRIINADVVYEGEYRTKNKLTGEYDLSGEAKSDTIIGYFAHFEMLNGFSKTLYMTKERVIAHAKKYSKSYSVQNGPWTKEFDAMATKTVVRGLLGHWGYLSVEMINAMDDDKLADAADRVQEEVKNKANKQPMGFEEADVVEEEQQQFGNGIQQKAPFED